MSTGDGGSEFAREAALERAGFLAEMWEFVANNKKWWLAPIIAVLLLVSAFVVLGGTAAAPFIYTLF
jgi:hypothetical protein